MDQDMDTGKREITERDRPHRFIDLCVICEHEIDSVIKINDDVHSACSFSLPIGWTSQQMQFEHSVCTYGGCMPDMDYRNKTGKYEE